MCQSDPVYGFAAIWCKACLLQNLLSPSSNAFSQISLKQGNWMPLTSV